MKGRSVPPRRIPAPADERRIQACLTACEHLSTNALESGLVQDALDALGLVQTGMAIAAEVAAQGKNPADYFDFAKAVKQAAAISRRLEASGFNEAMNQAYERRTGESLDVQPVTVLVPLRERRRRV